MGQVFLIRGRGISVGPVGDSPDFQEGKVIKEGRPRPAAPFPGGTKGPGRGAKVLGPLRINDVLIPAGHGGKVDAEGK